MRMTFGVHRGQQASEVPVSYLLWAVNSIPDPPACVLEELKRRMRFGGREARVVQESISSLWLRNAKRERKQAKRHRKRGGTKPGGRYVGEEFAKRRAEWLANGGDPRSVPWES